MRQTVNTLVINRVHDRDITQNMLDSNIDKATDFLWTVHIRYEWQERALVTSDKTQAAEFKKKNRRLPKRGDDLSKVLNKPPAEPVD